MALVTYGDVETLFSLTNNVQEINQNIQDCIQVTDEMFCEIDSRLIQYSDTQDEIKAISDARNKLYDDIVILRNFFQWLDGVNKALQETINYTNENNQKYDGVNSNYNTGGNSVKGANSGNNPNGEDSNNPENGGGSSEIDSHNKNENNPNGNEDKPNGDEDKPNGDEDKPNGDEDKPNGDEDKQNGNDSDGNNTTSPNSSDTTTPWSKGEDPSIPTTSWNSTTSPWSTTTTPWGSTTPWSSPWSTTTPWTTSAWTTSYPSGGGGWTTSAWTTGGGATPTIWTTTPWTTTPWTTSSPGGGGNWTTSAWTTSSWTTSGGSTYNPYNPYNPSGGSGSGGGSNLGNIGGSLGGAGGLGSGSGGLGGANGSGANGSGANGKDSLLASAAKEGLDKTGSLLDKLGKETVKFAKGVKPSGGNVQTSGANIGAIAAAGAVGVGALGGAGYLVGKKVISLKFGPRDWDALDEELKAAILETLKKVGFEDFEIETLQKSSFKVKADEINGHAKNAKKAQENDPEIAAALKKKYGFSFLTEDGRILKYLLFLILIIDGKKTIDDYNMYNIINPALPDENDVDFTYTGLTMEECIIDEEVAQEVQEDDIQFMNDPTVSKESKDSGENSSGDKEWLKDIGFENY